MYSKCQIAKDAVIDATCVGVILHGAIELVEEASGNYKSLYFVIYKNI